MKKKTVLVETSKQGKQWSIKVTSAIPRLREILASTLQDAAYQLEFTILNATDPFGKPKRKKKNNGKIPTGEIPANSEVLNSEVLKS